MQATRPPDRRTLHTVAYTALALIVLLSILGVLKSPWLLVAVWTLHPVWDLAVHRDLDPLMKDLPVACLIYDLIIAAYLAFRTWRGHLIPIRQQNLLP